MIRKELLFAISLLLLITSCGVNKQEIKDNNPGVVFDKVILSKEEKELLKNTKVVRVDVIESYVEAERVNLFLYETVAQLLNNAGFKVAEKNSNNYDAIVRVKVIDVPVGKYYEGKGYLYLDTNMEGEISLIISGKTLYLKKLGASTSISLDKKKNDSGYFDINNIDESRAKDPESILFINSCKYSIPLEITKMIASFKDINEIEFLVSNLKVMGDFGGFALVKIGKPAVPILISTLKDNDSNMRRCATGILGMIKDPRAIDPLIDLLKDKDSWVSISAKFALKNIGEVEPLIPALKHKDPEVREYVAEILGEIKDKNTVKPLIESLKDENQNVRNNAALALGHIGDQSGVEPLMEALKSGDINAADALKYIGGPKAIDALVEALKSDKSLVRGYTAMICGEIKDPRILDLLIKDLKDKDSYVRCRSAEALGKTKDPKTVEPLIEVLRDENENSDVLWYVANSLGWINDKRALDHLIKALKNENSKVRRGAAIGLEWMKDPKAVEPLIAALSDKDGYVKDEAVLALGEIGDLRAVEPLIDILKDKYSNIRVSVEIALGKIGSSKATEQLIISLKDEETDVRQYAASALGRIKDPKAVEPLIALLKDENLDVKVEVAEALGEIKDAKAIEPLIEAIRDVNSGVRITAVESLFKITGQNFGQNTAKWKAWLKNKE